MLPGDCKSLLGSILLEEMDVLIDPLRQELFKNTEHPEMAVLKMKYAFYMHKQSFFHSLKNALYGVFSFFHTERNGRIQLIIALLVVIAGFFFKINSREWVTILLCIALVISLEMINSSIEKLSDIVDPNYNLVIKSVKDISAASVLWSTVISVVIGSVIFTPKIMELFK